MSEENSIKNKWTKLEELTKIIIILIIFLIFFFMCTRLIHSNSSSAVDGLGVSIKKDGTPQILDTKGNPLNLMPCTLESGKNQCEISRERYFTESNVSLNISFSRKPGSTKCCTTVFYGGEVSEQCVTYPFTAPRCPKPGQVLVE